METLRIESRDNSGNFISTLTIFYKYHYLGKKLSEDGRPYHCERAELIGAEIDVTEFGDMPMPVTLNDELIAHYKDLITRHTGLEILKELVA